MGWIAPMALFYTWIHIGDPGYIFTILPALLVLAARSIIEIGRTLPGLRFAAPSKMRDGAIAAMAALIILANIGVYFFHPRQMTLPGIRQTDRSIAEKIGYIRANYAPGSVLLILYDLYRHLMYYLPDYDSLWLDVYAKGAGEKVLRSGTQRIILVDERLGGLAAGAKEIDLQHAKLYSLSAVSNKRVVYSSDEIVVK